MNSTNNAPWANDDGSGTAAVLECASIICHHAYSVTTIFVAVSGEEQGLLGTTSMAIKQKKKTGISLQS